MFFRNYRCKKRMPIRWSLSSLEPRLLLAGDVQADFTESAPNAEPTPVEAVYSRDVDLRRCSRHGTRYIGRLH